MYAVNQYDAIAESYDSLFKDEVSIEENNKIASMLFDVPGIILDVGCGTGLFLDILKALTGFEVKAGNDANVASIRAIRCLKFLGRSIPGIIIYASRLRCST